MRKAILFIGPPASGKGTQAKEISKQYKQVFHISTGDLIREYLNDFSGNYLDDNIVAELVINECKEIEKNSEKQNIPKEDIIFILDGIPRTPSQILVVESLFEILHIIYFTNISDSQLLLRMQQRHRTQENFEKRIQDYKEKSSHMITELKTYYTQKLIEIDASKSIQEINTQLINSINLFTK